MAKSKLEVVLNSSSVRVVPTLSSLAGTFGFILLSFALAVIAYYDDLQITKYSWQEVPTIYNVRILGLKILDFLSVFLFFLLVWFLFLGERINVTTFHKNMVMIAGVYAYAGIVGFIYSFFIKYDYLILIQDFQQAIYMIGFFLFVFHFLDTKRKWKIFVILFLAFFAAKNMIILYNSAMGIGIAVGDWAFRSSQNAEFAYFPMLFFPLAILIMKHKSMLLKALLFLVLSIYLYNSLLNVYRTVWVMLILGTIYLLFQLEGRSRLKLILFSGLALTGVIMIIGTLYPRFLMLAWNYKFASIFDWSIGGDRSNATRTLEIINVTDYVFRHFAFLQGMGLGAVWDDSARRLLPDLGSGFTYKTQFRSTHLFILTQFLKLGIVAMVFYWRSIYKMFNEVAMYVQTMSWERWEKSIVLGLNIGLLCAFISSADYVRLFTVIGINLGITASFIRLESSTYPAFKKK